MQNDIKKKLSTKISPKNKTTANIGKVFKPC